jgi:hypothetical protein
MVSIDAKTSALGTIRAARHFVINYLSADPEEMANIFGGRTPLQGADRFSKGTSASPSTAARERSRRFGPHAGGNHRSRHDDRNRASCGQQHFRQTRDRSSYSVAASSRRNGRFAPCPSATVHAAVRVSGGRF